MNKKILLGSLIAVFLTGCSSTTYQSNLSSNAEAEFKQKLYSKLDQSIANIESTVNQIIKPTKAVKDSIASKHPYQKTVGYSPNNTDLSNKNQPKVSKSTATNLTEINKEKAKVEASKYSKQEIAQQNPLDKVISINWKGEADLLVKYISSKSGMTYVKEGSSKVKSLPVSINEKNITVRDLLKKLDAKFKGTADIKVSTTNKIITLAYK